MTDEEKVGKGICPACDGKDTLHFGPQGGSATNFACFACSARFNAAFLPFGVAFLERTGTVTQRDRVHFRTNSICYDWEYVI